jgi:hypothetical protein
LTFGAGAVLAARTAAGAERPRVSIRVVGCEQPLAREVQRIASVELRATLTDEAPDPAVTQVIATCLGADATLSVRDPTTGKSLERTVSLGEAVPSSRARLLALAVAELVAASWSELETNPHPAAPAATALAPYPAREAARSAVAGRALEAAAVFDLHVLGGGDLLFGGGARLAVWMAPRIFLRVDGLADYGVLDRPTGTVAVIMPSGSAAVGLVRQRDAFLRPALSGGLRAGYVWMNGTSAAATVAGSHQQGVWLGPELMLQVSAWAASRVHPVLALSAGAHLVGVRGTVGGGRDVEAVVALR